MHRRNFLHAAAGGSLAFGATVSADDAPPASRETFELRAYFTRPGQRGRLDALLQEGLLPALERFGLPPVGVFYENADSEQPVVWVLIRHSDAAGPQQLAAILAGDAKSLAASATHLAGPKETAAYDRIETSILAGIDALPTLVAPEQGPRLFNLRIYESFNTASLHKKIEMFARGELDIFRRVGLTPVFFSETIAGTRLPSLTYLLVFPDDTARETAWQTFRADAEWQRMKSIPEYADALLVSRITNKILVPAEYSQI
jgi:hypothetical protein